MGDAKIKDALNTLQQRKSKWDQASVNNNLQIVKFLFVKFYYQSNKDTRNIFAEKYHRF